MKKISIVVPLYNEVSTIALLCERLQAVFKDLSYEHEFILVNDGSTDTSAEVCGSLAEHDKKIRYIEFSRNFGKEMATSAGIMYAKGDAIILIDADLQHPPEVIPQLLREWEKGAEVVIGVRQPRRGEGWLRKLGSRSFARAMNSISAVRSPVGATDFRLIDKKVADAFRGLREHRRLTRALIDWLGFRRVYVPFHADERRHGDAHYSYPKLFVAALSAVVAHSRLPLVGRLFGCSDYFLRRSARRRHYYRAGASRRSVGLGNFRHGDARGDDSLS